MKEELSIEEKAKAYDEAKARMSIAYNDNRCTIGFMNEIFPEPKESEDEKIRKKLLALIEWSKSYTASGITTDEAKEMTTWLEKRGALQVRTGIEWVNTIDDACDKRYSEEYAHGEYCHKQSFKWGFQEGVDWFEKQGEQKPILDIEIPFGAKDSELQEVSYYIPEGFHAEIEGNNVVIKKGEQKSINKIQLGKKYKCIASPRYSTFMIGKIYKPEDKFLCSLMNFCSDCFESIEDEQKPTDNIQIDPSEYINNMGGNGCYLKNTTQKPVDNVEPIFKIEEKKWYVCTKTYVLRGKIVVIKGQTYQAEKDNVIKGEDERLFIDRHDGKASEYFRLWTIEDAKDGDVLCAYPGADYPWIGIFCKLNAEGTFNSYCYLQAGQHCYFCPPSEENIFGKRNVDNHSSKDLVPATKEQRDLLFQKMKEAGYTWDAEKKKLKKEKVDNLHNYLYGEQKSAWNKEDDYVIERLFCLLHNEQDKYPQQSSEFQELEEIENKLKSFKERVQPKVELTQLDKNILEAAIAFVEQNDRFNYWCGVDKHTVLSTLHSLIPQNTWKPSEEEMVALEHAINCYSSISPTNTNEVFILEIMKERLKNLTK